MALPHEITKADAAELLGLSRTTLNKRIEDGAYSWPPASWTALVAEAIEFEKADRVIDVDDARFRRARADNHEIEAAKKRGDVAPIAMFEEQIVSVFGLFVQETEGAEARLRRSVPTLGEAIQREFRQFRESLATGVERYCESLEERAGGGAAATESARRRVGAGGEDSAAGERRAGTV